MGQPAVDLPDPLDQDPLDAAPSADDLLSQMAGEEIDRLLAEADLGQPQGGNAGSPGDGGEINEEAAAEEGIPSREAGAESTASDASMPACSMDEADPGTAAQLDALFEKLNHPSAPLGEEQRLVEAARNAALEQARKKTAEAANEQLAAAPAVEQQLDDLFEQLTGDEPAEAAPAVDAEAAVQAHMEGPGEDREAADAGEEVSAEAAAASPVKDEAGGIDLADLLAGAEIVEIPEQDEGSAGEKPSINPEDQTGTLEKEVLSAAIITPLEDIGGEVTARPAGSGQAPLWLRVLEWINAPMASWSDGVREAVGKVAIMTLINALALLAYVLIFR